MKRICRKCMYFEIQSSFSYKTPAGNIKNGVKGVCKHPKSCGMTIKNGNTLKECVFIK